MNASQLEELRKDIRELIDTAHSYQVSAEADAQMWADIVEQGNDLLLQVNVGNTEEVGRALLSMITEVRSAIKRNRALTRA